MSTRTALFYPFGSTGTFVQGATTFSSSAIPIEYMQGYSVQISSSGGFTPSSAAGNVSLSGSNDNITFVTINGSTAFLTPGSSIMINAGQAFYKYMKVNFTGLTSTSGFVNVAMLSEAWGA